GQLEQIGRGLSRHNRCTGCGKARCVSVGLTVAAANAHPHLQQDSGNWAEAAAADAAHIDMKLRIAVKQPCLPRCRGNGLHTLCHHRLTCLMHRPIPCTGYSALCCAALCCAALCCAALYCAAL